MTTGVEHRLPVIDVAMATLDSALPGLVDTLSSTPLRALESEGNPGIRAFKEAGGPGLLIPKDHGGHGLSARDAARVQVALGFLAPSTAVAVTMHQFTAVTFVELLASRPGMEWVVIEALATQSLLVASAFAEGDPGGKVLSPTMRLTPDGPSYRLSGRKKPCSLSESMDMITVSTVIPETTDEFGIVLLGKDTEGVSVEPFWESSVLAGAETGTVVFDNVSVPTAAVSYVAGDESLDRTQRRGYLWFELCITASYVGITARVVSEAAERARSHQLLEMACELESCTAILDHLAGRIDDGEATDELLARTLSCRYAIERSIQRATDTGMELLGVNAISQNDVLANLLVASRALSYHPPSRKRTEGPLVEYFKGAELDLEQT
jgi:alkylation response protein AidB-like acyl-CoA dehydrogenase